MAYIAAFIFHKFCEPSFVAILMTGFTEYAFKMKDQFFLFQMTLPARYGKMRTGQSKPAFSMLIKCKCRGTITLFGVAFRTIVAVLKSELTCMFVFVTIDARFYHKFKSTLERLLLFSAVTFAAFHRRMFAVQRECCEIMIEIFF
jgi:hypothetical protein